MKPRKSHEQFANELHEKNPKIELLGFYEGCHERILCKCAECGNMWNPKAYSLLNGRGCPSCAHTKTSFMEQAFLFSMKTAFPDEVILARDRSAIGMELDIFIPNLNIAIEPGSWAFHGKHISRDATRRQRCEEAGIRLISIFDSFPVDEEVPNHGIDTFTFTKDFNQSDHKHLRAMVEEVLRSIGKDKHFSETEWKSIEKHASNACHRKTTEQFKNEIASLNLQVEVLGEYENSKSPIKCKCVICGHVWEPIPNTLLLGHGCPKCAVEKRACAKKEEHAAHFVDRLKAISPNIMLLEPYEEADKKLLCRCVVCSNEWKTTPSILLSGYGCPKCGTRKAHDATRKSIHQFQQQLRIVNPDVEVIGEYINNSTPILTRCKTCGYEWLASPKSLLRGSSHKGAKTLHKSLEI